MTALQHPPADIQSPHVSPSTKVWQFVVIMPSASIGAYCNICSDYYIEKDVIIKDRVTVKSGMHIWDGLRLEDDVFFGVVVTFPNDLTPRSKQYPTAYPVTTVRAEASIGGGYNPSARHHHRPNCHDRRWYSGDPVGAGWHRDGRQSRAYYPMCWGPQ